MNTPQISVDEAKQDKLFYVVSNVVIVNTDDASCLLLKRSDREKVLPGKWGFPGGKLEHSDVQKLLEESGGAPIEGIDSILGILAIREAREECGLSVSGENYSLIVDKVFVRPDFVPVFMATIAAKYTGGEVVLEVEAFSDYAWVPKDHLTDYDCIEGVREEAAKAIDSLARS